MTKNAILGAQVKRLLSSLSEHSAQHLSEMERDVVQTNILLREAIEKLSASFMAIHEAVSAQQELVESLASQAGDGAQVTEQLRAKREEIGQHVNAAVTGLQFQDMTSQLLGRTIRRITGLRDVMEGVGSGSAGMAAEGGTAQLHEALVDIHQLLESQSQQLESELWRAVCQTHMESGDIELF